MTETKIGKLTGDLAVKNRTEIPNLPFLKKSDDQIVFWNVRPSGDYVKDCRTGRVYGELVLEHMVEADFSPLLTWCIADMPRKKDYSGIEVGFLEFFAEMAISNLTSNGGRYSKLAN